MDDFESKLLAEEADLERKLAAVRAMKVAYGIGEKPARVAPAPKAARSPRGAADRMDKFGSYGQHIIDTALKLLPGVNGRPVMTRLLVDQLEARGVEVRGENKVNALSALLARSSKIKGYGRAGWTRASEQPGELYPPSSEGANPSKENEPNSDSAAGSDAPESGAATPSPVLVHSNWGRGT